MPATVVKRRRAIPYPRLASRWRTTYSNQPGREDVGNAVLDIPGWQGTQYTESENHPGWRTRKPGVLSGDVGGNFFTQKKYVIGGSAPAYASGTWVGPPNETCKCSGFIMPCSSTITSVPPDIHSSDAVLMPWGTRAIARCKPTNRVSSALQACIELYHEGLPKVIGSSFWKARTKAARRAGDEYLNYQFGFAPLANDIASFAAGVVGMDQILAQYERDVGKVVRRGYSFPPEVSEDWVLFDKRDASFTGPNTLFLQNSSLRNKGQVIRHRETYLKRWFSGAFTYYIPPRERGDGTVAHVSLARRLLGIELTPELIWNVAPWSWAVDWVSSAGDVISNLTSWQSDGLVMRYGYIMEHSYVRDTYTFAGPTGLQSTSIRPPDLVYITETKIRRHATPFGFGLLLSQFTARQKAIMIALGLTKWFH